MRVPLPARRRGRLRRHSARRARQQLRPRLHWRQRHERIALPARRQRSSAWPPSAASSTMRAASAAATTAAARAPSTRARSSAGTSSLVWHSACGALRLASGRPWPTPASRSAAMCPGNIHAAGSPSSDCTETSTVFGHPAHHHRRRALAGLCQPPEPVGVPPFRRPQARPRPRHPHPYRPFWRPQRARSRRHRVRTARNQGQDSPHLPVSDKRNRRCG